MAKKSKRVLSESEIKLHRDLLQACGSYLDGLESALKQQNPTLPDASHLASMCLPGMGIDSVRITGHDRFSLGLPFAALKLARGDNERYVDQPFLVILQLFAVSGCRLTLSNSKVRPGGPERWYLTYGNNAHQLLRLIADAHPGTDTRLKHPTAKDDAHYDLRRATLANTPKPEVRERGQLTRTKGKGRREATVFALDKCQSTGLLDALGLAPNELEMLFVRAFALFDESYSRLMRKPDAA